GARGRGGGTGAGGPSPSSANRANDSRRIGTPARIRTAPTTRRGSASHAGDSNRHRVIHHGPRPRIVPGAITRKRADPRTAIRRMVTSSGTAGRESSRPELWAGRLRTRPRWSGSIRKHSPMARELAAWKTRRSSARRFRIPETWSTLKTDSVLTDVVSREILDGTSEGGSGLLWKTL